MNCVTCNCEFEKNRPNQKTCSAECRKIFFAKNAKYRHHLKVGHLKVDRKCLFCSMPLPIEGRIDLKFCSDTCSQRNSQKIKLARYKSDPAYRRKKLDWAKKSASRPMRRVYASLKSSLWALVKERKVFSDERTMNLVGCSLEELKSHLEKQFDSGMSWDNYGTYWHIDHIKPQAAFQIFDRNERTQCFHFSNLQPMESSKNISKGAKFEGIDYRMKFSK